MLGLCASGCVVLSWKHAKSQVMVNTLHQILSVFQHVLCSNKIPFNIFDKQDLCFDDLQKTLNTICVRIGKQGVGTEALHAPTIPVEHEKLMWESGVLRMNLQHHCYMLYPSPLVCILLP